MVGMGGGVDLSILPAPAQLQKGSFTCIYDTYWGHDHSLIQ